MSSTKSLCPPFVQENTLLIGSSNFSPSNIYLLLYISVFISFVLYGRRCFTFLLHYLISCYCSNSSLSFFSSISFSSSLISGILKENFVPTLNFDSNYIPWFASGPRSFARSLLYFNSRPVPFGFIFTCSSLSSMPKGLKSFYWSACLIPIPVSSTEN